MAMKQEAAGLTAEAADNYFFALQKNRNNIDAQIGMKKNGQLKLNSMLGDFAKAKNFGSAKDAVYAFLDAQQYKNKIEGVGIKLDIADFYQSDFRQVKDQYLASRYDEASALLEKEAYDEAEAIFQEIKTLEPNYKDTKELSDIAYLEPRYQRGVQAMQLEHYREAYSDFGDLMQRRSNYKDAAALRKKCLEKGTYTIAILPFENATGVSNVEARISAYALDALTSINDPFLKIVDREHMNAILQEQKLQLSGVVDQATAVQVGELVGAQAVLTGTVLSYGTQTGSLRSKSRDAYEGYVEQRLNPADGKTYPFPMYKPVQYTEYYNNSSCNISFQYKLISLKTGEIVKSDIITQSKSDEILYAKYNGSVNNLYPSDGARPLLGSNERRTFMNIFSSRQDLKNMNDMTNDMFNNVSKKISADVGQQVIQLVP